MGLFSVFNSYENDKNKSHIKNLLEVAIADGRLDDSELKVIIKIAAKFDITEAEVHAIKEHHKDIQFAPPSSYSAKVNLLEDVVSIMTADMQIDEQEVKICKDLATRLDINPVLVDDLVKAHDLS
jgi:uncharacterized tellurite resistance protein B-like protein